MVWTPAPCLVVLRDQINEAYPNRSKASDGLVGDKSHQATASDHNPNSQGVVCAFDITHDPAHGFDANQFAEIQRKNPHPNLKYMVWNKRICSRKYGWTWRPSSGHTSHIHVSVGVGSDGKSKPGTYNNTTKWDIGENMSADALTKEEIIVIYGFALNEKPNQGTYNAYLGKPLSPFLTAVAKLKTLQKLVGTKELIKPSQCPTVTTTPAPSLPIEIDVDAIAEAVVEKLKGRLEN